MHIKEIIKQLESNQYVFKGMLSHKSAAAYLWRPTPDKWNLLEIVCHLCDEEREDFKALIKHIFKNPSIEMPAINPEGWVLEKAYASHDYKQKLEEFLIERQDSISWLNNHLDDDWDSFYKHPKLGNMSAKLFLTNWLAHDYLHIRQITRHNYNFLKEKTAINLQYAGNW